MPKRVNLLKKKLLEDANEIASRLEFGCAVYEQRVYSTWNMLIEENGRTALEESLEAEIEYCNKKIEQHPQFAEIELNPFNRVRKIAIVMQAKLKEGSE